MDSENCSQDYQSRSLEKRKDRSVLGLVLFVLACATLLRMVGVYRYALGPDEMMVWSIARGRDLYEVLRRTSFEVHPPLEPIVKHFLLFFSTDPDVIRLGYVGLGLASLMFLSFAVPSDRVRSARLIIVMCAAISETLIHVSVLLRGYCFLLFGLSVALWSMRRIVQGSYVTIRGPALLMMCSLIFAGCCGVSGFLAAPAIVLTSFLHVPRLSLGKRLLYTGGILAALVLIAMVIFYFQFHPASGATAWRSLARSDLFSACSAFSNSTAAIIRTLHLFSPLPLSLTSPTLLIVFGFGGFMVVVGALAYCWHTYRWICTYSAISLISAVVAHAGGIYPISSPRHMVFVCLALLLPVSVALARAINGMVRPWILVCCVVVYSVVCAVSDVHFKDHPDFSVSRETQRYVDRELDDVGAKSATVFASRFGLLYVLQRIDGQQTFYMGLDSVGLSSTTVYVCAPELLWQSTRASLSRCVQDKVQESVWLFSAGFADNLMSELYGCFTRTDRVLEDRTRAGVQLFRVRTADLMDALTGECLQGVGRSYREDHCARAIL